MAILRKGISWTAWAVASLIGFGFGLVGATPPGWAAAAISRGAGPATVMQGSSDADPVAARGADPFRASLTEELQRIEEALRPPVRVADQASPPLLPAPEGQVFPKVETQKPGMLKGEAAPGVRKGQVFPKVETQKPGMLKGEPAPGALKEVIPKLEIQPRQAPMLEGPGPPHGLRPRQDGSSSQLPMDDASMKYEKIEPRYEPQGDEAKPEAPYPVSGKTKE